MRVLCFGWSFVTRDRRDTSSIFANYLQTNFSLILLTDLLCISTFFLNLPSPLEILEDAAHVQHPIELQYRGQYYGHVHLTKLHYYNPPLQSYACGPLGMSITRSGR